MKVTYTYKDVLGMEVTKSFVIEPNHKNLKILEDMFIAEQQQETLQSSNFDDDDDLPF